ncbi:MAG TPA: hypothetical protein PK239_09575 [Chitinophagales bacterium]|nr:hypothetical protein [Chitinophagales bacterium]
MNPLLFFIFFDFRYARRITEVPPYLSNHYTTQLPAAFPVIRQLYEVFLLRRMYVNTRIYDVPNGSLLPLPLSF